VLIVLPLLFGLVLLGLLFLFFAIEAWRRRAVVRPLLAMFAALILSGGLAFAGHFILGLIRAGDYWRAWPVVATTAVYASALAACAIALLFITGTAERTKLRAAFWLFLTALGGSVCFIAPGAAIYFLLPPLVMALGMVGKRWHRHAEQVGAIAAAILLFVTFGPAIALFEELMSGGPIWMFAPLGALVMLPALIELRPALGRVSGLFALAGALDLAILGWIVAGFTPAYSADKQQLFAIEYVWDATTNSGRFAVNNDGAPVPYAGDWQRVELPYATRKRWVAPAPAVPVTPPGVAVVEQVSVHGSRALRLRFAANGAEAIGLIAGRGANLRAAGAGMPLQDYGDGQAHYYLRCAGRACDGAEVILVIGGDQPVDFTIVGSRSGLPQQATPLVQARPANARPQYGPDSTIAIARVRL